METHQETRPSDPGEPLYPYQAMKSQGGPGGARRSQGGANGGAPGLYWFLLTPPGSSWPLLAPPGSSLLYRTFKGLPGRPLWPYQALS